MKPKKISEIGLQKYFEMHGLDYEEFCRRDDLNEPDTIIGRALNPDKPIDRRTIASWRELRKKPT